MRRLTLAAAVLALLLAGCGWLGGAGDPGGAPGGGQESPGDAARQEAEVRRVVEEFGRRLQMVSLLGPEDQVRQAMEEHYGPYVTPQLLEAWQADPLSAPGRTVSSPWPDRIEIDAVTQLPGGDYQVDGRIIEVTSVEQGTDQAAAVRPVTLVVRRVDDRWLIDQVTLGEYRETARVAYESRAYGFRVALPASWEGFTVVTGSWEGRALVDDPGAAGGPVQAGDLAAHGPLLRIRHAAWTAQRPRQDIPIMVFTLRQWEDLQQGRFSVGAAPVPPTELARNDVYVLALPARYNYEFPEGYEEVEAILAQSPVEPLPLTPNQAEAADILASLPAPAAPAAALLEEDAGAVVGWFTALEAWLKDVVLLPNTLQERGAEADGGVREQARGALLAYFGPEYAGGILDAYWVPASPGEEVYSLEPTEAPGILPFMAEVQVLSVDRSQVVIHAENPPPALWEDVTVTYRLSWLEGEDSFRVEAINIEGR